MTRPLPNRLAVYLTAGAGLLAALAPIVADLDWESTAGVVAGVLAITGVVSVWLNNWGKWERGEGSGTVPVDEEPPDEFDETMAEPIPAAAVEAANAPEGSTPPSPRRKG